MDELEVEWNPNFRMEPMRKCGNERARVFTNSHGECRAPIFGFTRAAQEV